MLEDKIANLETTLSTLANQSSAIDNSVVEELVVWINPLTGDDNNEGTEMLPLVTFDAAVKKLSEPLGGANLCIIRIVGQLDLGTDPIMCSFPLKRQCKHLILKGSEYGPGGTGSPQTGTLTHNPANIGIARRNWVQIRNFQGGFVTNSFQRSFIRNENQNRVFVIESHTDQNFDLIFPSKIDERALTFPLPSTPTNIPVSDSWFIGDDFTLFTVSDSITWTGTLTVDVEEVVFSSLKIIPTTAASRMVLPNSATPRVYFTGCHFISTATGAIEYGNMAGSFVFQGVVVVADIPGEQRKFIQSRTNRFIQMESVWFEDGAQLSTRGLDFHVIGMKMSNCKLCLTIRSNNFVGASMLFENGEIRQIDIAEGVSTVNLLNLEITTTASWSSSTIRMISADATVKIYDAYFYTPSHARTFDLRGSTRLTMEGTISANCISSAAILELGSYMIIDAREFEWSGITGPLFEVNDSDLYITFDCRLTLTNSNPIVRLNGGNLKINYSPVWVSPVSVIEANAGSTVSRTVAVTNTGTGNVIDCGTITSDWSISIADTQNNVFCSVI